MHATDRYVRDPEVWPVLEGVRLSHGTMGWPWRLLADSLVVAGLSAVTAVLFSTSSVVAGLSVPLANDVLSLSAAAIGVGAGILAAVTSRLLGEPKLSWFAAALLLYCVVVLPWGALAASDLDVVHRASRLLLYVVALVLLVVSIHPPRVLGVWGGWTVMVVGGLGALAVLLLPAGPVLQWLVQGPLMAVAVLVSWTAVAVGAVVEGIRRQSNPSLRIGLGLVVLAVSQLYRVATSGTGPAVSTNLPFAALRLVGLAVVLVGAVQVVQQVLARLASERWQQQEELAAATLHMVRAGELAAERGHELRNGLAGLAGITHLLSTEPGGADHERLKHAVLAELGRLHRILDGLGEGRPEEDRAGEPGPPGAEYLVEPLLAGLVVLRSDSGRIRLDVEKDLRARGDSAVLAQVVTNLLLNCERHAPGAPVTVRAFRRPGEVVVEVRDEGPGLPLGDAGSLLDRGVHDVTAGGSGLGLHISGRLLAREGGTLELRTVEDPRGCLATLTVPVRGGGGGRSPVTGSDSVGEPVTR